MKIRAVVTWLVLPLIVGIALLYAGAWTAAGTALVLIDNRFFGLTPADVLVVDDFVVWALVSLPAGLLVGFVAWRRPISIALLTCGVAWLAFLASALLDELSFGVVASLKLFAEPLLTMIVFVPLGAFLGAQLAPGLTMRWSGP